MAAATLQLSVQRHPSLYPASFVTRFKRPIAETPSPESLLALLKPDAAAPLVKDETIRLAVRDMLREGGYKPAGRGKPASEYLSRAAEHGVLTCINLPDDACNVVSLHSGLPISVIDLDHATAPFTIRYGLADEHYVFNVSGQVIQVDGLLCLCDAEGPCANAVKDAQRTKTSGSTTRTLSVIWGIKGYEEHVHRARDWYRALLEAAGGITEPVETDERV